MMPHSIEIDQEVFEALQARARPFVDSPNDILRQLLLIPGSASKTLAAAGMHKGGGEKESQLPATVSADSFVREIVAREFGPGFRRRAPYRMMYEDEDRQVYFQNFSKEATHLWYRVTDGAWKELRSGRKTSFICFTNPVERYFYLIPVADVWERTQRAEWKHEHLVVNIDPLSSRWTELNWDISRFRKTL